MSARGPMCASTLKPGWIDAGTAARTCHAPKGIAQDASHQAKLKIHLPADVPGRLLLAAQCGLPYLPADVKAKLAPLLTLDAMVVMAGAVLALGAAHAVGVGFAVDVVLGVVTVAVIGTDLFGAARQLQSFYRQALAAQDQAGFDEAGKAFAAAVATLGFNTVLILLTRGLVKPGAGAASAAADTGKIRAAWMAMAERISFKVPRDKGMLWSKLSVPGDETFSGMRAAGRLAQEKGLVNLESILEREGFLQLYSQQFGAYFKIKGTPLEAITRDLWKLLSERYAASLEGKVTAYVHNRQLGAQLAKGGEPMLVDELWTISEVLQNNSRISSVELIDVTTGRSWHMLRAEVLKSAGRSH